MEDHRGAILGACVGEHDGKPVELAVDHLDVARLEPPLDERGGGAQLIGV